MRLLKSCLSSRRPGQQMANPCVFCQIAQGSTSTALLYADERVVAFPDIKPSAFRAHINRERTPRKSRTSSVNHMLNVGKDLLKRDAPESELHRFGFHRPPFNSVNHLHLHCLALPFIPSFLLNDSWKCVKYTPMAFGGFQEAENLLEQIKPPSTLNS
ncbi:bifunctional adenosine 5'-phosphosulfate phosphorylase/adenylylsulfatase HINT4 isoform X2 [Typha latifolia]|uniref:bifunctional adenosine 5'-phosphosulfate phosphorylase/adenylylsulfatase HINT4 isoform X2 n=1 Tax=Typha latifolia TaxID=4733 RepID=UPI003C2FCC63